MAPAAVFAMNRATRQVARFFAGDEHGRAPLPEGWEELRTRDLPPGYVLVSPPEGAGWFTEPPPPTAGGRRSWRRWFTWAGALGLVLVLSSVAMFSIALSNGIHCPHCDAQELGPRLGWWERYFEVKDALWLASVPGSLSGALLGQRRRWGVLGVVVALVALVVTPG